MPSRTVESDAAVALDPVESRQPVAALQQGFQRRLPELDQPRVHDELLGLADQWAEQDPEEAVRWLAELKFDDARNPFLFAALTRWAEQDPDRAIAWLDETMPDPGASRDYLLASLVRGIARSDSGAAERVLLGAPNSPERSGAVDFLVQAWLREGAGGAFEKAVGLPASERQLRERAIARLVSRLPAEDLPMAIEWAEGLASSDEQVVAFAGIAAKLSQQDPGAAAGWATALEDLQIRRRALGEVATRWARMDPIAAGRWLEEGAGDQGFDLARRAFAGNTVNYDPEVAFAQVAAIADPALREQSFEQIGRLFLNRQPERSRDFFESSDSIPQDVRQRLLLSFE